MTHDPSNYFGAVQGIAVILDGLPRHDADRLLSLLQPELAEDVTRSREQVELDCLADDLSTLSRSSSPAVLDALRDVIPSLRAAVARARAIEEAA